MPQPRQCSICMNALPERPPKHKPTCCERALCGECVAKLPRLEEYCPFCQSDSSSNPQESFRPLPPAYESHPPANSPPPSYPYSGEGEEAGKGGGQGPVIHHLRPTDSMQSLSLLYGVPVSLLRSHNRVFSDTLLHARRSVEIPSPPYRGGSLSGDVDAEAEGRKIGVKRFQLRTKCVDVETAQVYLKGAGWDVDVAVGMWEGDERWVRENPMVERKVRGGKGWEVVARSRGGEGSKWGLRGFGY